MDLKQFLYMDGYAAYVWSSYALWFAVVVGNVWFAVRSHADARTRALRRLQAGADSNPAGPVAGTVSQERT